MHLLLAFDSKNPDPPSKQPTSKIEALTSLKFCEIFQSV